MSRWNENEFIKHAQSIAQQHLVTKKSLNELSEKFANENSLNPEEIRTLVRLANVATFQEMFKNKADGDKMVEFETGDPEAVIRRMVSSAGAEPQSANIHNDKLAGELPDMMRDKREGRLLAMTYDPDHPEVKKMRAEHGDNWKKVLAKQRGISEGDIREISKKASEGASKPVRQDVVVMNLRKLASEFSIEKLSAGARWEEKLGSLVKTFRRAPGYGPSFGTFEKEAWSSFGADIAPEMAFLYEELRVQRAPPALEKVAAMQDRVVVEDTAELSLLKEAVDARKTFQKMSGALTWIDNNMPALGR